MKIKIILILVATSALFFLNSCNTIHGAGQDVKRVGSAVSNL